MVCPQQRPAPSSYTTSASSNPSSALSFDWIAAGVFPSAFPRMFPAAAIIRRGLPRFGLSSFLELKERQAGQRKAIEASKRSPASRAFADVKRIVCSTPRIGYCGRPRVNDADASLSRSIQHRFPHRARPSPSSSLDWPEVGAQIRFSTRISRCSDWPTSRAGRAGLGLCGIRGIDAFVSRALGEVLPQKTEKFKEPHHRAAAR